MTMCMMAVPNSSRCLWWIMWEVNSWDWPGGQYWALSGVEGRSVTQMPTRAPWGQAGTAGREAGGEGIVDGQVATGRIMGWCCQELKGDL